MIAPGLSAQEVVSVPDRWNRAAMEWIQLLQDGAFQEAGARVDPVVPEGAMGPPQLQALWAQISAQLGALQSVDPGAVSEQGIYRIVDLPATFENQSLILRVVLTDSLLVSGFFLRPSEPPAYQAPDYVDMDAFRDLDLTVGADPWVLPGSLSIPLGDGPHPGVVLVHGSGPNDRDETVGGSRPFRDLAWGLASRGIAVLRYDKRTRVHGSRIPGDIGLEEEVISDALAALELLRARPEVDPERIFVLGHSLGGILAPEIGERDGRLAGIILLAATARPFFEVLIDQLEYLSSLEPDPDSAARRQVDSLVDLVIRVREGEASDDEVVLGAPTPYWRELAAVDPVATARDLDRPLLILQGARDYQAREEDLRLFERGLRGKENVTTRLYPSLNHLFAPGTGMATPEEYTTGQSHVAEEVVLDLARWILEPERRGEG